MSYLHAILTAEARNSGRGVRSALVRHRRLQKRPLGMIVWQLGAEPFTAAAIGWGFGPKDRQIVAPGEPRDRTLTFREILKVARSFNPWFEGEGRDELPQIVVPNRGTLTLLGRLGRRLAFLPTGGANDVDPDVVQFGRHLRFLADRARFPGQQLVIVLTELLAAHWVTELSALEAQNLAALDAAIDPPKGKTGHVAAVDVENDPDRGEIGPVPSERDDRAVGELLSEFNRQRSVKGVRDSDEAIVRPLRRPIEAHYTRLIDRGWPLLWRCLERERKLPEAPSVERRAEEDEAALDRHMEWMIKTGGITRTRQTHKQAAYTLRSYEEAQRLLETEEAVDDRLKLIPYLATNQAIGGKVVSADLKHQEQGAARKVGRPLVTIETDERCTIAVGKALYWINDPGGREYTVDEVKHLPKGGSRVRLKRGSDRTDTFPKVGADAIFTALTTKGSPPLMLPELPWTHTHLADDAAPSIEDPTEVWE